MLSPQLALWLVVLISTCSVHCGGPSERGSLNDVPTVYYKEHQIRTEQLCPDLQESVTGRDIDTANHPYKSVFKLAEQVWRTADPCVFEARGPRNIITTVVIKAIQAENQPWNYSGAQPCPEHIKLRIPVSRGILARQRLPLCTVQKPPNSAKLFQGPYYNPHVWQLSNRKMGLSFALYENETLPLDSSTDDEDNKDNAGSGNHEVNEITQLNSVILSNAKLPKFVHIVFASFIGDACSLRVQQYILDPTRKQCNASVGRIYALCGAYPCSEEESVLRQAGFWMDDATHLLEKYKLIDFLRSKQFRHSSETSLVDFFLNLMRLMIMPMVFFVAYYVTRQVREKLTNRQLQLQQTRSSTGTSMSSSSQLGGSHHLHRGGGIIMTPRIGAMSSGVVDSPTSSSRRFVEEPPPPYDTINFIPPSYVEATTQKIDITSSPTISFPPSGGGDNTQQNQVDSETSVPVEPPNMVVNDSDQVEHYQQQQDGGGESNNEVIEPTSTTPWAIQKITRPEELAADALQETASDSEIIIISNNNEENSEINTIPHSNLPSLTQITRIENITEQV